MRIAVCDDDRAIRDEISRLVKKQMPEADIAAYQSGEEMISAGEDFDISFLDIEMGKVSGMDIARHIREKEASLTQRSILIFVTGYREYMEEAFDVNAFHYLIKPIDPEKFAEVFDRARKEMSAFDEQNKKQIMVKTSGIQQFSSLYVSGDFLYHAICTAGNHHCVPGMMGINGAVFC